MDFDLDRFLEWANNTVKNESERLAAKRAKIHPPIELPPVVFHEPEELDLCPYCRLSQNCKIDMPDIQFGKASTPHGQAVVYCETMYGYDQPDEDAPCWICGKPGCRDWIQITHIEYRHRRKWEDVPQLLMWPEWLIGGTIPQVLNECTEVRTYLKVPIHDQCYDIGEI